MNPGILKFYEEFAGHYHLIFDDWDSAMDRQTRILSSLLHSGTFTAPLKILDCACGIGTQAIGFAALGHAVVASDISHAEIDRARHEALRRSLNISFHISDMTSLQEVAESGFDVVVAMDNALPHLDPDQIRKAAHAIASKLKPGGLFMASIRDYDKLIFQKPSIQAPAFYGDHGSRRIVHQVWDWMDDTTYLLHLYLTIESHGGWMSHHFVSPYRCLLREELTSALQSADFEDIQWLMPNETRFYQPIVRARRIG